MSAVETRQMSAAETRQMSPVAATDIFHVSIHNVQVSAISISQCSNLRNLNCGNVTMYNSKLIGLPLNRQKWTEMGPEWWPGPENRAPRMPRPFPSLWDQSRGPKSTNKAKKMIVWGLALGLCGQCNSSPSLHCVRTSSHV